MVTPGRRELGQTEAREVEKMFRPSGSLLETQAALGRAIEVLAVAPTAHNPTTLDLLVRLMLAPDHQLRGVDLCRQLHKSPGHVSRVIDHAESEGLVERRPDPNDRRAQRITLTDAGDDVLGTFVPLVVEVLDDTIYTALDNDEVEILVDLLQRIAASAHHVLEQHEGAPARPR
jgi:DNA-binding MarR family transcriptional regulator